MKKGDKFIEDWGKIRTDGKFKYLITDNKYSFVTFLAVVIISFLVAVIVSIYTETDILNAQIIMKTLLRFFFIIIVFIIYSYMKWINNEKNIIS